MKRPTNRHAIATIGCACAVLAGCGNDGGGESLRPLPKVTGLPLAEAEQRLEQTNVFWTFSEKEGPEAVDFDTARESSGSANKRLAKRRVISQDPKPAFKVGSGDVVLLKLRR